MKIGKLQKYSRKVSGSALRRMSKLSSFCLSSRKIFWIMNFSFSVQWLEPSYATRNQRSLKQIRTWWCMETSKLEIYVPIRLFFRCDMWNDEIVTGNRKSIGFGGIVLGFEIFRDYKVWKGFKWFSLRGVVCEINLGSQANNEINKVSTYFSVKFFLQSKSSIPRSLLQWWTLGWAEI